MFEGIDGSGKDLPNAQTKLGRFLKTCLRESRLLDVWTQHVLFSIHRWEFMPWITEILEKGEAILCERYAWSGLVYSSALAPTVDIQTFMGIDMGLMAPDLVVYVDTAPRVINARTQIPSALIDPCVSLSASGL